MTELSRVTFILCTFGLIASSVLLGLHLARDAQPSDVVIATALIALNAAGVLVNGLNETTHNDQ